MTRPTSAIEPFGKYRLGIFYFLFLFLFYFACSATPVIIFPLPKTQAAGQFFEMRHQSRLTFVIVSKVPSTVPNGSDDVFEKIKQLHCILAIEQKKKKKEKNTKQNATNILSSLHSLFFLLIIKLFCFSRLSPTFQTEFVTLKT